MKKTKTDTHRYDDIINLPHHVSKTHPQMSLSERAAQFAPFAALTGHDDAIKETARLTEKRVELDENAREILDAKLNTICKTYDKHPQILVLYFRPDEHKSGGTYVTAKGILKKIDEFARVLIMEDGLCIPIEDIYDIEMNEG